MDEEKRLAVPLAPVADGLQETVVTLVQQVLGQLPQVAHASQALVGDQVDPEEVLGEARMLPAQLLDHAPEALVREDGPVTDHHLKAP